jgi:hypothetical protein
MVLVSRAPECAWGALIGSRLNNEGVDPDKGQRLISGAMQGLTIQAREVQVNGRYSPGSERGSLS